MELQRLCCTLISMYVQSVRKCQVWLFFHLRHPKLSTKTERLDPEMLASVITTSTEQRQRRRGQCVCEEAPVQIMTGYHCAPDSVNLRALHTGSLLSGLHMNRYGLWRLYSMLNIHLTGLHVHTVVFIIKLPYFFLLNRISFFKRVMIFRSWHTFLKWRGSETRSDL